MAIDPQNKKNVDETTSYIRNTLISVSAQIGEAMRDAIEEAFDSADASVIKSVGTDLTRTFKSAAKLSDDLASNTFKINSGLIGSKDIQKQIQKLAEKRSSLERKIEDSIRTGVEINEKDRLSAERALNVQAQRLKREKQIAEIIEKRVGGLGAVFERLSKNKFLGSIVNADEALQAMRTTARGTKNSFAILGSGISAAFKGIEKASVVLFAINSIVKAAKFLVSLFISADESTTQIGKNLGVSKANAEGIRQEFVRIAEDSTNILATSAALLEAQKELVDFSGAVTLQSFKQADAQVLLTKNLGIAGENAAMFQSILSSTVNDIGGIIESTRVLADEQFKTNGFFISNQEVLKDIANTSAEISGYYGFSADNLAKAAFQTRKFGLSLQQAKNISEGLLNFEQSISSELELELLSGKQFNLERARSLALTGDLAGATEQVMMEMSKMTKAQRQNPILMRSFSELTGLSADELNRAYLVQTTLNQSTKDYIKLLEKQGRGEEANLARQLGLQGLTREEIERNISVQDKFNASLIKAKDQLSGLVDSNIIDKLGNLLIDFVERANKVGIGAALMGFGKSSIEMNKNFGERESFFLGGTEQGSQEQKKQLSLLINRTARSRDLTQESLDNLVDTYGDAAREAFNLAKKSSDFNIIKGLENLELKKEVKSVTNETELATGGIVTQPTRALVGEAGSEAVIPLREFYAKMDEMISAVKEGKTINLDGRRVNEGLFLATSKFDRR